MRSLLKKHTKRIVPRRPRLASSANANGNGGDDDGIRLDGEEEQNNPGLQLESDVPPIEELAIEYTAAEIRQREAEVVAASEVWWRSLHWTVLVPKNGSWIQKLACPTAKFFGCFACIFNIYIFSGFFLGAALFLPHICVLCVSLIFSGLSFSFRGVRLFTSFSVAGLV